MILKSCHVHPTAGHFGKEKTLKKVEERFTWKGPGLSRMFRFGELLLHMQYWRSQIF